MMPMEPDQREQIAEHLGAALDALLAAVVLVDGGGEGITVPGNALDVALGSDPDVQDARAALREALRGLGDVVGVGVIIDLESAVNAYAARCAEAGFNVGVRVGQSGR